MISLRGSAISFSLVISIFQIQGLGHQQRGRHEKQENDHNRTSTSNHKLILSKCNQVIVVLSELRGVRVKYLKSKEE